MESIDIPPANEINQDLKYKYKIPAFVTLFIILSLYLELSTYAILSNRYNITLGNFASGTFNSSNIEDLKIDRILASFVTGIIYCVTFLVYISMPLKLKLEMKPKFILSLMLYFKCFILAILYKIIMNDYDIAHLNILIVYIGLQYVYTYGLDLYLTTMESIDIPPVNEINQNLKYIFRAFVTLCIILLFFLEVNTYAILSDKYNITLLGEFNSSLSDREYRRNTIIQESFITGIIYCVAFLVCISILLIKKHEDILYGIKTYHDYLFMILFFKCYMLVMLYISIMKDYDIHYLNILIINTGLQYIYTFKFFIYS